MALHRTYRALIFGLAVAGGAVSASAEDPRLRDFKAQLQQTLDDELATALRRLDHMAPSNARSLEGTQLASVLGVQTCAAAPDDYWDAAMHWMVGNVTPRLNPGVTISAGPYRPDLRRQVQNLREEIEARPVPRFLEPSEKPDALPANLAAAARQRAEWTAAVPVKIAALRAAQESDPSSMRHAVSLAVWTHASCQLRAGNAEIARAMLSSGYPDAAAHGERTELAFAFLVRTSGDGQLAADAMAAGGEHMSTTAQRLLSPTTATHP